jgi:hypothetical protein
LALCLFVAALFGACAKSSSDDDSLSDGGNTVESGADGYGCANMCSGMCTNLKLDPQNCGSCGKACPTGANCVQGTCQCGAVDGGTTSMCGGQCVDTKSDVNNCGACNKACGSGGDGGGLQGGGTWACTNGMCTIQCVMPKTACPPTGCFDLQKDNTNCGMCGNDCMGNLCVGGMCCQMGEVDCNGMCTNTQTDLNNCGMCGNKCMMGSCNGGKCGKKLVGNYTVSSGPAWGTNPPCYTCQEACALKFGGMASSYSCSTQSGSIDNKAQTSIWGVSGCAVAAENYKKSVNYNCGQANCSQSAYVQDNCLSNNTNYCWQ